MLFSGRFDFTCFRSIELRVLASDEVVQLVAEPAEHTTEVVDGVVLFMLSELIEMEELTYSIDGPPVIADSLEELVW